MNAMSQNWDLKSCVEYAMTNNIQVKISQVQAAVADVNLGQSKASRFPAANITGSGSFNNGLNQNPITFSQITENYVAAGLQLQTSADIFNFFSKRNTIIGNEWDLLASRAGVDKIRYDIALTVANAYLQALLTGEQEKIAELQILQSKEQLFNTRKLVNAGSLPELNAAQMEAQLAADSANMINARSNASQALLRLQQLLNLDPALPFSIATPPVELIPVEPIGDLQPEFVYLSAIANQPQQKANQYKLWAAEKYLSAAKGSMKPTLSAFGSLGSSFYSKAREVTGTSTLNLPIGNVDINNTSYLVYPLQPFTVASYGKSSFDHQLKNNFRQSVGLALSIPLFNGYAARAGYERNLLNVKTLQLQQEQDKNQLKQDIYQAYNAAMVALERFNASKRLVETNEKTFSFAQKRYDVGMLNSFDLISAQNNLFRARLEYSLNRFDYVFKLKVLEFYKGQGLKL
jgi:outer membrane protein